MASWDGGQPTPTARLASETLADDAAHLELYEMLVDAAGSDPGRGYESTIPLADNECRHGRLPHEECEACAKEAAA